MVLWGKYALFFFIIVITFKLTAVLVSLKINSTSTNLPQKCNFFCKFSLEEKIHYFQNPFAYIDKSVNLLGRILSRSFQLCSSGNVSPQLHWRLILVLGLCHLLLELQISLSLHYVQALAGSDSLAEQWLQFVLKWETDAVVGWLCLPFPSEARTFPGPFSPLF